jgi:hypothetical protein
VGGVAASRQRARRWALSECAPVCVGGARVAALGVAVPLPVGVACGEAGAPAERLGGEPDNSVRGWRHWHPGAGREGRRGGGGAAQVA